MKNFYSKIFNVGPHPDTTLKPEIFVGAVGGGSGDIDVIINIILGPDTLVNPFLFRLFRIEPLGDPRF